jgi:hypothetical protein
MLVNIVLVFLVMATIYTGAYNLVLDYRPPHHCYRQITITKSCVRHICILPRKYPTVHRVAVIEQVTIFILSMLHIVVQITIYILGQMSYVSAQYVDRMDIILKYVPLLYLLIGIGYSLIMASTEGRYRKGKRK